MKGCQIPKRNYNINISEMNDALSFKYLDTLRKKRSPCDKKSVKVYRYTYICTERYITVGLRQFVCA